MAYGMSVLIRWSKLAPSLSPIPVLGTSWSNGLDMVHPPIWYVAWAYCWDCQLRVGTPRSLGDQSRSGCSTCWIADPQDLSTLFSSRLAPHSNWGSRCVSFIARRNSNMQVFC